MSLAISFPDLGFKQQISMVKHAFKKLKLNLICPLQKNQRNTNYAEIRKHYIDKKCV